MAKLIPAAWMKKAAMQRIHLHWTAGGHKANSVDKKSYHILVEGDGGLVKGDRPIHSNAKGSGIKRASHTLNANTGAIGVSLCCMRKSRESPFDAGPSPMTKKQWNAGMKVLAELADFYNIKITPRTILTHAEVQPNLNIRQKNKWDITRLAFDPSIKGHADVGDEMRAQVAAQLDLLRGGSGKKDETPPDSTKLAKFRVSGVHPSTLNFRDNPDGNKIGALPERTVVEFISAVGFWWQVRTRLGHVGWVWSEFLKPVN
ncbi:N-acetylmuramoyl-L-alanine amidase [Yoonia sp. SS1-5]|uniref:Amidase n=1 Tax=Yoonia rhodophyticola TaxID=3137370 RepID=A0AAN0NH89_9RHOB